MSQRNQNYLFCVLEQHFSNLPLTFFSHVRVTIIPSLWNTFWESALFLIEYYDTCWGQGLERDFMETDFWFSVIKKYFAI